jgi:hypothetical protein
MGIVRKVLLGLENRAGCIFSLLLNAFEWRLRFKIWNWVGTLSFHDTAVIFLARNDRWFAHLHIQNGGSKIIWLLTYSWTGNFLLAWAGQFAGIKNQTMHRSMNKYIENFAYSSIVSENKIRRQAGVARFLLSFTDSYLKNWCWKILIWFTFVPDRKDCLG